MAALGEWLKQLVLIVLLATFIDLLLPNKTMQRYVRTVIGLFLLMVLIGPVFRLLSSEWNLEKVAAQLESMQQSSSVLPVATRAGGQVTTADILKRSEEWQRGQIREALALTEEWMSGRIREGLSRELGEQVLDVRTTIELDAKQEPVIRQVLVILAEGDAEAIHAGVPFHSPDPAHPTEPGIKPIEILIPRIEPVTINLSGNEAVASTEMPGGGGSAYDPVHEARVDAVATYVRQQWGVNPNQLEVKVGAG